MVVKTGDSYSSGYSRRKNFGNACFTASIMTLSSIEGEAVLDGVVWHAANNRQAMHM